MAFGAYDAMAFMNSSAIQAWTWNFSSTLKMDLNFSPSDCLETLPFPGEFPVALAVLGERLSHLRSREMTRRAIGLTKLYNQFHSAECVEASIWELRDIQVQIDSAVVALYGWQDIALNHGFHTVPYLPENDRVRYTICEEARLEILRGLSRLNRERWQAEQEEEQRLAAEAPAQQAIKRRRGTKVDTIAVQGGLI